MLQQILKLHSSCSPSPDKEHECDGAAVAALLLLVDVGIILAVTAEAR